MTKAEIIQEIFRRATAEQGGQWTKDRLRDLVNDVWDTLDWRGVNSESIAMCQNMLLDLAAQIVRVLEVEE